MSSFDDYYDGISEGYEELHEEEQLKKIALIKKHFSPQADDKLLDVGCGTGLTTEPWGCKRYGIDPASKLIARARQKDKIEYRVAPAESIPYHDDFFDIVISITAIQNFSDIPKAFDEMKRVCKKDGRFVLSFLKKSQKHDLIEQYIMDNFDIVLSLQEDKDKIFIANYK